MSAKDRGASSESRFQKKRSSVLSEISDSVKRKSSTRGGFTPRGSRPKKVNHKGWLEKRGPSHRDPWEKLWFTITDDEMIMYKTPDETPENIVDEILLSEYVNTVEFKKKEAPGDAPKYVKSHPFGFVIDSEPWWGVPDRLGMFYVAADSAESMNQWIVQIHKASKRLKGLAPSKRTSLAEFVALWDAPIVLASSPHIGFDKEGNASLSVPAICAAIVGGESEEGADTSKGGIMGAASTWFNGGEETEAATQTPFPLHKYFTVACDFGACKFCDERVRSCINLPNGEDVAIVTGRSDLDQDLAPAFTGTGAYNEEARFELACENSFAFTYWRGRVIGAVSSALVNMGNKALPPLEAQETSAGQINAEGLRVGNKEMSSEEFEKSKVRIVVVATFDGGQVEAVQKKNMPHLCKRVIHDLKKTGYPWANDVWTIWCHFPSPEDFVLSLAGSRNLVPDNTTGRQIGEDEEQKPITYTVHKQTRQPPAMSLLGNLQIEEILGCGFDAVMDMIEGLLNACDEGDIKQVRSILDRKCDVTVKDDSDITAIEMAAGQGHADIVRELLERRADPNTVDNQGDTVLTVAVGEGRLSVVQLLLECGADKDLKVNGEWVDQPDTCVSLVEVAEAKGFDDIAALFQPKGASKAAPKVAAAQSAAPKATAPLLFPSRVPNLADELSELTTF